MSEVSEDGDAFYNFYEYPSDDEIDVRVASTSLHHFDDTFFHDGDEYRIFAQTVSGENKDCALCEKKLSKKEKHLLFLCPTFKAMTLKDKCALLQEEERCFNCLARGHGTKTCQSKRTCSLCEKRHHSLICIKSAKPEEDVSFITDRLVRREGSTRGRGRGGRGGRGVSFRGSLRGRGQRGS